MSTITSRRGALLGSAFSGLIGASAVAKAAQSSPLANPDAELIAICDQLEAIRALQEEIAGIDQGAPDGGPLHEKYQALGDEWKRLAGRLPAANQPTTMEGIRAASRMAWGIAPRDSDDQVISEDPHNWIMLRVVGWAAGKGEAVQLPEYWPYSDDNAPAAIPVGTAQADAGLIQSCERLIALRQEREALRRADQWVPDHGPLHARYKSVGAEINAVEAQIYDLPVISSLEGARAAARTALATAGRDTEGLWEARGITDWLALSAAEFLAGDGVA